MAKKTIGQTNSPIPVKKKTDNLLLNFREGIGPRRKKTPKCCFIFFREFSPPKHFWNCLESKPNWKGMDIEIEEKNPLAKNRKGLERAGNYLRKGSFVRKREELTISKKKRILTNTKCSGIWSRRKNKKYYLVKKKPKANKNRKGE